MSINDKKTIRLLKEENDLNKYKVLFSRLESVTYGTINSLLVDLLKKKSYDIFDFLVGELDKGYIIFDDSEFITYGMIVERSFYDMLYYRSEETFYLLNKYLYMIKKVGISISWTVRTCIGDRLNKFDNYDYDSAYIDLKFINFLLHLNLDDFTQTMMMFRMQRIRRFLREGK